MPAAPRIRRLPDQLIDKIAAGEVLERPAAAVKELVENALDADSSQITVELRHAGTQLIRVVDDGIGMTGEELSLALTRHATSKIASEADLDAVQTLGFRGEALPAICAVARFTLLSCPRGAEAGTRVSGAGGVVAEELSVAAPAGTSVTVEDLFFNTPARLKFLKSLRTELAVIMRGLGAIALAHPGVHLRVLHDGRPSLTAPRAARLRDRTGAIYGFDVATRLLDVDRKDQGIAVSGLVAPPQLGRGNRDDITLIVNGRPVRDTLLTQTLLDAYRPLLARDQFPLAVLRLGLPPQEVDVNVHPTKAWVRFRSPRLIQEALFVAVQEALRSARVVQHQPGLGAVGAPPAGMAVADLLAAEAAGAYAASPASAAEPQSRLLPETGTRSPELFGAVVGQVQDTFVVSASEEEVFFVDQHVAHERVLFERLRTELAAGALASQELLFAEPLELARGQVGLLEEWGPTLERLGFAFEGFGGSTVLLRAVPALLRAREPRRLIQRLIDEVSGPARDATAPLLDRALAFVACRAAIKAPAPLEREEMRRLLTDLSATETPYFCPHGRPIVSRLSLREIKRELKRTW